MIEIYTAGDADTRKKNEPPPPGGYGTVAVAGQQRIFTTAGQITTATPHVATVTGNLADLIAITRALQWAAQHPRAHGRPICIRYNSEYAARICTGEWRARKHKAAAAAARHEWARLKKSRGQQVYMRHAARTNQAQAAALALALRGKKGAHVYAEVVQ